MVVDFEQGARQSIPVAFVGGPCGLSMREGEGGHSAFMPGNFSWPLPPHTEGNLLKWRSNDVANAQNCRALFSKDGRLIFVAAPKATPPSPLTHAHSKKPMPATF